MTIGEKFAMYKFDRVESLAEMKETCFFIKAIDQAIKVNKFNKQNLMVFKDFLKSEYNLEIPLSKLYLFVEKIEYLNNGKLAKASEIDKIVKSFLEYNKDVLTAYEINIIKAELNIKDPKYNLGDYGYKSAKELSTDISVTKKLYYGYNNWLLIASFVVALFLSSALVVVIGSFYPKLLVYFESKAQEVILFVLILSFLTYALYYLFDFIYRKKTWHLKAQIDGYNKYIIEIEEDYNKLLKAKRIYSKKLADLSINGIEFSENLLYNYLTLNDKLDVLSYSSSIGKRVNIANKAQEKQNNKIGVVLSKKEQEYNWFKSETSKTEKQNINKELVARVDNLAQVLKSRKVSTINLAKSVSELYCNDLSVEKRRERIDNAESRYELTKNYLSILEKIEEYEKLSFFENSNSSVKSKLKVQDVERNAFKDDLFSICDRIEKAYSLKLIDETKYQSYRLIKDGLNKNYIYGKNISEIDLRAELSKLYIKLYEELIIYDILN